MKQSKYGKTPQFKDVKHNVKRSATYVGNTEEGDPIYDTEDKKPVIQFTGTVKVHGTNAAVCYNAQSGLFVQSREKVYSLDQDTEHAGFVKFVAEREGVFIQMLVQLAADSNINTSEDTVYLYGEWCCGNIQPGVGVTQVEDKHFLPYACKAMDNDNVPEFTDGYENNLPEQWIDISMTSFPAYDPRVIGMSTFGVYVIDVDFNAPEIAYNKMCDWVDVIEAECPVAKYLGVAGGVGEGLVFEGLHMSLGKLIFKMKGTKHAGKSHVKAVKKIDEGVLLQINTLVDAVTPVWRLSQFYNEVVADEGAQMKQIGPFIKLVMADIVVEEQLTIKESGLEFKKITGALAAKIKGYFFEQMAL
jgi:hypothetical protein